MNMRIRTLRRIPLARWLAAVPLAGLLLAAPPAAAQTVEGRMVEAGTGEPLAGAAVMLLEAAGGRVDFAITDAEGRFRLVAPAPGRFRLAFERIGYEGSESGAFALAAGEVSRRRLEVPVRPLALPAIEAVTRRRCAVRPAEGEAAFRIWNEVRKALEAAVWTERRGALRYTLLAWDRRLDPWSLEVVDERVRRAEGTSRASPWIANDPERLVREGFVRPDGDEFLYDGPDASTILSDAFLDTHCFRPVPPPVDRPGWIGLAFEPERGADVVDVRGVLWVDRESSELRRLDFDYVGLPRELRFDVAGGRVEFERVATGEWIVKRWRIRMPIVGVPRQTSASRMRMDAARNRPRLLEVEEDGGEVEAARATREIALAPGDAVRVVWSEPIPLEPGEIRAPADRPGPAALADAGEPAPPGAPRPAGAEEAWEAVPPGVVVQAVVAGTGEPIDGVQISVSGSGDGGSTGEDGRVALGPLRTGRLTIELERLGYVPFETVVEVPPDGWRRYRVEVHPMPILAEPIEATIEPDRIRRAMGEARYRLTAEEIPDHTPLSVPELIAYRLPGLQYVRTTGWASMRESGPGAAGQVCPSFESRNGTVQLFIIDGVRYTDACVLETLAPGDIEEVAVITSYAGQIEFDRPGGGVVIIRTKLRGERPR